MLKSGFINKITYSEASTQTPYDTIIDELKQAKENEIELYRQLHIIK